MPPTAPDYANARFLIAEMQLTLGNLDGCRSEMAAISALPHRDEMNNAVNYWTGRP